MSKLIEIYTDGACSQGQKGPWPGGCAAILVIDNEIKKTLRSGSFNTTNNVMELEGFLLGLELAEEELQHNKSQVIIYTDSAYIHNCFKDKWYEKWIKNNWLTAAKEPVKNQELWIKIFNLVSKINPKIEKVEAHSNNKFNNAVDLIAFETKYKYIM